MSAPDSFTSITPARRVRARTPQTRVPQARTSQARTPRSRQAQTTYRSTSEAPEEIFLNVVEVSPHASQTDVQSNRRAAINPAYRQSSQIGSAYQPRSLYTQSATPLPTYGRRLLSDSNDPSFPGSPARSEAPEDSFARGREEREARRRARKQQGRSSAFAGGPAGAVGGVASQLCARGVEFFSAGFEGVKHVADAVRTGGKSAAVASDTVLETREARTASAAVATRSAAEARGGFRALKVAAVVLVALVALGAFMYSPVKALYCAKRNAALYQTQLTALAQSNQDYQDKVEYLESRSGIEDLARKRGYVYSGETAVSVDGAQDQNTAQADTQAAASTLDGVTTDDPWYIKLLDRVFGYTPSDKVG